MPRDGVEQAFWKKFAAIYGEEKCQSDQGLFEDFYANEFNAARDICGFNPASVETVHKLKECGYRVALATNPIFPHMATENRIRWAGLVPEDFEIYTTLPSFLTMAAVPAQMASTRDLGS